MAVRNNMFTCLIYLWAVHFHRCSPSRGHGRRLSSTSVVQAFSGDLSSSSSRRQRQFSSRALTARTSAHPSISRSCQQFSAKGVPCSRIWGAGITSPQAKLVLPGTHNDGRGGRSLLIRQSTISDETAEAEITLTKASSGQTNGDLHLNGNADVPITINGSNTNSQQHQLENNTSPSTGNADVPIAMNNGSNNGSHQPPQLENKTAASSASETLDDTPTATANGGYTHTASSRAKISAANKGKTPWNKGQQRSPEVRARIAEGVRRRNREKFLAKLAAEGITEEEHAERKKAERREKERERRARRTAKGGYTPTEETKKKISKILKEKYASGEVQRKPRDPSKVRRGFKHTEETKQKIRESLKRKWAEDEEYRELMTNKTVASGNVGASVRKRISETLKKKWEEPEFRAKMMDKFKTRKLSSGSRDASHRKKISDAMKKKWMDEEYRKRATDGMAKGRETQATMERNTVRMVVPVQPKMPTRRQGGPSLSSGGAKAGNVAVAARPVTPMSPMRKATPVTKSVTKSKAITKAKVKTKRKKAATKRKKKGSAKSGSGAVEAKSQSPKKVSSEEDPDGSIERMRQERRDLYDLLYGDEEDDSDGGNDDGGGGPGKGVTANGDAASGMMMMGTSNTMAALLEDDDNLDDFDPYGLH